MNRYGNQRVLRGHVAPVGPQSVLRSQALEASADAVADRAVRTAPAAAATTAPSAGLGLSPAARQRIESALGAPLGDVRVRGSADDRALADSLGARAFAFGNDIVLGSGESANDIRLVAHEAAHVVQQRQAGRGPVVQMQPNAAATPSEATSRQPAARLDWLGNDTLVFPTVGYAYLWLGGTSLGLLHVRYRNDAHVQQRMPHATQLAVQSLPGPGGEPVAYVYHSPAVSVQGPAEPGASVRVVEVEQPPLSISQQQQLAALLERAGGSMAAGMVPTDNQWPRPRTNGELDAIWNHFGVDGLVSLLSGIHEQLLLAADVQEREQRRTRCQTGDTFRRALCTYYSNVGDAYYYPLFREDGTMTSQGWSNVRSLRTLLRVAATGSGHGADKVTRMLQVFDDVMSGRRGNRSAVILGLATRTTMVSAAASRAQLPSMSRFLRWVRTGYTGLALRYAAATMQAPALGQVGSIPGGGAPTVLVQGGAPTAPVSPTMPSFAPTPAAAPHAIPSVAPTAPTVSPQAPAVPGSSPMNVMIASSLASSQLQGVMNLAALQLDAAAATRDVSSGLERRPSELSQLGEEPAQPAAPIGFVGSLLPGAIGAPEAGDASWINYFGQSAAGEALGVDTILNAADIYTGDRTSLQTPYGWESGLGYHRTHLLAHMFRGSRLAENLITAASETNAYGRGQMRPTSMLDIEWQVRHALDAGQTVRYRVIPMFDGQGMPVGISMQARGTGPNAINIETVIRNWTHHR